jgi:hypothetical protein
MLMYAKNPKNATDGKIRELLETALIAPGEDSKVLTMRIGSYSNAGADSVRTANANPLLSQGVGGRSIYSQSPMGASKAALTSGLLNTIESAGSHEETNSKKNG